MTTVDRGFEIVASVFTPTELAPVAAVLAAGLATRTRAGARHLLSIPAVRQLATEPRLLEIARRFVGPAAIPFRATLFDKSADANWLVVWHQDTALPLRRRVEMEGWGPWSVKGGVLYAHAPAAALVQVVALRVHLDHSTSDNGPLRVLPGSHTAGLLTDEQIARLQQDITPVECLAAAGGVVAMRPLVVHSSSKSREARPRRVLHIEYATGVKLGSDIELADV
jgi:hypothetical protein